MIKRKTIQELYVDQAHYIISGSDGQKVVVKIDYTNAQFDIIGEGKRDFLHDVSFFAKDLIERKSRVNFA